jgi:2-C-methyl-D-erythritol 4-phosphate cytidylyltransferase
VTAKLNARGDVAVLVPAAGAGLRLGPGGPKALRLLAGEPLLAHAIRRIAAAPSVRAIVVAAPEPDTEAVRELLAPIAPVTVVAGGRERQESVARALAAVPPDIGIVLVHDAARALTPPQLIESVAAAVRSGHPAVIPVLPVVDTIKEVRPLPAPASAGWDDAAGPPPVSPPQSSAGGPRPFAGSPSPSRTECSADGPPAPISSPTSAVSAGLEIVVGTVDRAFLRSVQTPQGFRYDVLVAAHAGAEESLTDDAGLMEKAGVPVTCVPGTELAMKITRPLDLVLAEALLHVP